MSKKKERNSLAAQSAQRNREERKERDSRAAQAAKEHREQQKEKARLKELRKKQAKKAKHRARRRIDTSVWKRGLIMAAIAVALVLTMVIFFRVGPSEEHILVEGSKYYTREEVAAASGVNPGDNLLTISRAKVAGNIIAQLPYVASVQMSRQLPDTVILSVREYNVTYAVKDAKGNDYLISRDGKITEKISEREAKEHIRLDGLIIKADEPGAYLYPDVEDETLAIGQLDALDSVLNELETTELIKHIASVSIPAYYDVQLWYGDQYLVKLGSADNLEYKLTYLGQVISKLDDYRSGTIDLSFSEGNEARFTPND